MARPAPARPLSATFSCARDIARASRRRPSRVRPAVLSRRGRTSVRVATTVGPRVIRVRKRGGAMATVIEVLTEEHRLLDRLFEHYAATHDPEAAAQLGDALVLHSRIEEEFLYPLVRTALVDGGHLSDEAEDDHEKVKQFVAEAEDTLGPALDELV